MNDDIGRGLTRPLLYYVDPSDVKTPMTVSIGYTCDVEANTIGYCQPKVTTPRSKRPKKHTFQNVTRQHQDKTRQMAATIFSALAKFQIR